MAVTICLSTDTKVGKGEASVMCVCAGVCVCALGGGAACKGEKESAVPHLFVLVKCWRFRVMVLWGMGGSAAWMQG